MYQPLICCIVSLNRCMPSSDSLRLSLHTSFSMRLLHAIIQTGKPRLPHNWKAEEVKCISGGDLLKEWAAATSRSSQGKGRK
jgi:hypothetical protein